ncbi:MAG: putative MFS family arabinose efflux permease [Planctomycetota bacterium]
MPLLYGLVMAQVGLGTFFASAQSAAIPSIVDKDELQDAYAVSSATWSFTLSLGAALGGLSVRYLGTQGAIVVDALTYVVSASLLLRLRLPEVEKHPQPFRLRDILLFTDIRRGLAHARERGTGAILLAKSLWGGAGGFLVALSLLSRQRFAASGPDGNPAPESVALIVGLFYAARGLGTGAGPVIARRFLGSNDKDLRRQIRLGFALGALGYALIPLTSSFGAALACVALSHSGGSILWVASTTFWQRKVDNAYRGRVFALEFLGMTLSFALGGLAAALVFDATQDLKRTLWTSVSLVALGGLLWSWIDADRRKLPDTTPSE